MMMWRSININNVNYLTSLEIKSKELCITLSDLTYLWRETLSREETILRFKECNLKANLSEERIIEFVEELFLSDSGSPNLEMKISGDKLKLDISKTLIVKMSYYFTLTKLSEESAYRELILPLLMVINELKYAQEELYKKLEAKDIHLKEFELEGCHITRNKFQISRAVGKRGINVDSEVKAILLALEELFNAEENNIAIFVDSQTAIQAVTNEKESSSLGIMNIACQRLLHELHTKENVITSNFKKEEFKQELKPNLEERIKIGIENASSIFIEGVNEVYPAFQNVLRIAQPLCSKSCGSSQSVEERNVSRIEEVNEKPTVSRIKRNRKGNEETIVCKRLKSTKKIIL